MDWINYCVFCCQGKRTTKYAQDESSITHEWIRLLDVPKCLLSRLSAFHFKGFKGFNDELELVREILQWARVLKKMTISSYPLDSEKKFCVLKELLMFPRQSVTCEIAFNCDESWYVDKSGRGRGLLVWRMLQKSCVLSITELLFSCLFVWIKNIGWSLVYLSCMVELANNIR